MIDDEKSEDMTGETPAAEAREGEPEGAAGSAGAEAGPELSPKERRASARSAHTGQSRAPRTLEERLEERAQRRAANAAERRRWRARRREKRRSRPDPGEGTPPAARRGTGRPRVRQGVVVSDKADKTITVQIDVARQHRTYGKIVRTTTKLHAHDERNEASAGDTVRVVESRPLSRTKRWRLLEILERAR